MVTAKRHRKPTPNRQPVKKFRKAGMMSDASAADMWKGEHKELAAVGRAAAGLVAAALAPSQAVVGTSDSPTHGSMPGASAVSGTTQVAAALATSTMDPALLVLLTSCPAEEEETWEEGEGVSDADARTYTGAPLDPATQQAKGKVGSRAYTFGQPSRSARTMLLPVDTTAVSPAGASSTPEAAQTHMLAPQPSPSHGSSVTARDATSAAPAALHSSHQPLTSMGSPSSSGRLPLPRDLQGLASALGAARTRHMTLRALAGDAMGASATMQNVLHSPRGGLEQWQAAQGQAVQPQPGSAPAALGLAALRLPTTRGRGTAQQRAQTARLAALLLAAPAPLKSGRSGTASGLYSLQPNTLHSGPLYAIHEGPSAHEERSSESSNTGGLIVVGGDEQGDEGQVHDKGWGGHASRTSSRGRGRHGLRGTGRAAARRASAPVPTSNPYERTDNLGVFEALVDTRDEHVTASGRLVQVLKGTLAALLRHSSGGPPGEGMEAAVGSGAMDTAPASGSGRGAGSFFSRTPRPATHQAATRTHSANTDGWSSSMLGSTAVQPTEQPKSHGAVPPSTSEHTMPGAAAIRAQQPLLRQRRSSQGSGSVPSLITRLAATLSHGAIASQERPRSHSDAAPSQSASEHRPASSTGGAGVQQVGRSRSAAGPTPSRLAAITIFRSPTSTEISGQHMSVSSSGAAAGHDPSSSAQHAAALVRTRIPSARHAASSAQMQVLAGPGMRRASSGPMTPRSPLRRASLPDVAHGPQRGRDAGSVQGAAPHAVYGMLSGDTLDGSHCGTTRLDAGQQSMGEEPHSETDPFADLTTVFMLHDDWDCSSTRSGSLVVRYPTQEQAMLSAVAHSDHVSLSGAWSQPSAARSVTAAPQGAQPMPPPPPTSSPEPQWLHDTLPQHKPVGPPRQPPPQQEEEPAYSMGDAGGRSRVTCSSSGGFVGDVMQELLEQAAGTDGTCSSVAITTHTPPPVFADGHTTGGAASASQPSVTSVLPGAKRAACAVPPAYRTPLGSNNRRAMTALQQLGARMRGLRRALTEPLLQQSQAATTGPAAAYERRATTCPTPQEQSSGGGSAASLSQQAPASHAAIHTSAAALRAHTGLAPAPAQPEPIQTHRSVPAHGRLRKWLRQLMPRRSANLPYTLDPASPAALAEAQSLAYSGPDEGGQREQVAPLPSPEVAERRALVEPDIQGPLPRRYTDVHPVTVGTLAPDQGATSSDAHITASASVTDPGVDCWNAGASAGPLRAPTSNHQHDIGDCPATSTSGTGPHSVGAAGIWHCHSGLFVPADAITHLVHEQAGVSSVSMARTATDNDASAALLTATTAVATGATGSPCPLPAVLRGAPLTLRPSRSLDLVDSWGSIPPGQPAVQVPLETAATGAGADVEGPSPELPASMAVRRQAWQQAEPGLLSPAPAVVQGIRGMLMAAHAYSPVPRAQPQEQLQELQHNVGGGGSWAQARTSAGPRVPASALGASSAPSAPSTTPTSPTAAVAIPTGHLASGPRLPSIQSAGHLPALATSGPGRGALPVVSPDTRGGLHASQSMHLARSSSGPFWGGPQAPHTPTPTPPASPSLHSSSYRSGPRSLGSRFRVHATTLGTRADEVAADSSMVTSMLGLESAGVVDGCSSGTPVSALLQDMEDAHQGRVLSHQGDIRLLSQHPSSELLPTPHAPILPPLRLARAGGQSVTQHPGASQASLTVIPLQTSAFFVLQGQPVWSQAPDVAATQPPSQPSLSHSNTAGLSQASGQESGSEANATTRSARGSRPGFLSGKLSSVVAPIQLAGASGDQHTSSGVGSSSSMHASLDAVPATGTAVTVAVTAGLSQVVEEASQLSTGDSSHRSSEGAAAVHPEPGSVDACTDRASDMFGLGEAGRMFLHLLDTGSSQPHLRGVVTADGGASVVPDPTAQTPQPDPTALRNPNPQGTTTVPPPCRQLPQHMTLAQPAPTPPLLAQPQPLPQSSPCGAMSQPRISAPGRGATSVSTGSGGSSNDAAWRAHARHSRVMLPWELLPGAAAAPTLLPSPPAITHLQSGDGDVGAVGPVGDIDGPPVSTLPVGGLTSKPNADAPGGVKAGRGWGARQGVLGAMLRLLPHGRHTTPHQAPAASGEAIRGRVTAPPSGTASPALPAVVTRDDDPTRPLSLSNWSLAGTDVIDKGHAPRLSSSPPEALVPPIQLATMTPAGTVTGTAAVTRGRDRGTAYPSSFYVSQTTTSFFSSIPSSALTLQASSLLSDLPSSHLSTRTSPATSGWHGSSTANSLGPSTAVSVSHLASLATHMAASSIAGGLLAPAGTTTGKALGKEGHGKEGMGREGTLQHQLPRNGSS